MSRPRTIALGVALKGGNDYRLTVRVQNPLLIGGKQVMALQYLANGEVDVRYIGAAANRNSRRHFRSRSPPSSKCIRGPSARDRRHHRRLRAKRRIAYDSFQ